MIAQLVQFDCETMSQWILWTQFVDERFRFIKRLIGNFLVPKQPPETTFDFGLGKQDSLRNFCATCRTTS
jgi:hypothetical protein